MRKSIKIKNYEEALEKGYIGIGDYSRQANTGLSRDMMKKLVAGDFMCNKKLYKKYLDGLTDD